MARVVEAIPSALGGGRCKYPWQDWLDGRSWLLDPAEDFPGVTCNSFRSIASAAASERGMRAAVRVRPEGVYLKGVPR